MINSSLSNYFRKVSILLLTLFFGVAFGSQTSKTLMDLSDSELQTKLRMLFLVAENFSAYPNQYGGYIYYQSNINDSICSLKKEGSLYLVDHEGGRVNRIGSKLPAASKALAIPPKQYDKLWMKDAASLKAMCFDVVLGPTIDKELSDRSFSHDFSTNLKKADEIKKIITNSKLISTYKHFPGRYPTCKQKEEKREIEYCEEDKKAILKDWIAFKDNDVPSIMISNYVYMGVSLRSAVLEPQYYDMLRKTLNYKGIIMTDALWEMSVPLTSERVWTIFKGSDLIMIMNANEVEKYLPYIIKNLKTDNNMMKIVEERFKRLDEMKKILN